MKLYLVRFLLAATMGNGSGERERPERHGWRKRASWFARYSTVEYQIHAADLDDATNQAIALRGKFIAEGHEVDQFAIYPTPAVKHP